MKFPELWKVQEDPNMQNVLQFNQRCTEVKCLFLLLWQLLFQLLQVLFLVFRVLLDLLMGGMTAGFILASMLNNAGGAWDNAKKYIERGNYGGKKSECHKASVVGDTVGDPFKDTSGPSINILIKLMSMVSVVLAGVTVAWSIFG